MRDEITTKYEIVLKTSSRKAIFATKMGRRSLGHFLADMRSPTISAMMMKNMAR
jgi:hypothetical protein